MSNLRLPEKLDLLGEADVCVIGGGLAGLSAALAGSAAGCKTALIEERGALAWEIPHGLEIFLERNPSAGLLADLTRTLAAQNAFRGQTLDPVAVELACDTLAKAAGVRLHFRMHAAHVDLAAGVACLATKSGPVSFKAQSFVDATESARVARNAGAKFAAPHAEPQVERAALLCAVQAPAESFTLAVPGLEEVHVRPTLWANEAHLRIRVRAESESQTRFALAKAIEALRARPGFEKASLALSSHEGFALSVPKLDPHSLPENLAVAGPAVLGRKPSLEERVELGLKAATLLTSHLRAVAAK